jgi:hypothetical protein
MPYKDPDERRKYHRERARAVKAGTWVPSKQKRYTEEERAAAKKQYNQNRIDKYGREHLNKLRRDSYHRTKYGMSAEEAQKMRDKGCEICGSTEDIHIDHDHTTGVVRGPLCSKCNQAIGLLDEDIYRLKAAIDYITFHKEYNNGI